MNVSLAKRLLVLFIIGCPVFSAAVELEQTVEVTAITTYSQFDSISSLSDSMRPPEHEVNGRFDSYWNSTFYFSEQIRTDLRYGLSSQNQLYISPDNSDTFLLGEGGANYRWRDLDAELWSNEDGRARLLQQLDLLSVTYSGHASTISVGRQAISFGTARVFSPVDVLQPLDLLVTDSSYRPGVDALRGNWYLGAVTELDAGIVFGVDQAVFLRAKTFANNLDWEATAININQQTSIFGISTNGGIGVVGLWQESALLVAEGDMFLRSSIGADTTVFEDLYVMTEWHYNAVANTQYYLANAQNKLYQLGAVVPQANWYASVNSRYPVNPLVSVNVGSTVNIDDLSALVTSGFSLSVSDNSSITGTAALPLGDSQSASSEYGSYPLYLYFEWDWVF